MSFIIMSPRFLCSLLWNCPAGTMGIQWSDNSNLDLKHVVNQQFITYLFLYSHLMILLVILLLMWVISVVCRVAKLLLIAQLKLLCSTCIEACLCYIYANSFRHNYKKGYVSGFAFFYFTECTKKTRELVTEKCRKKESKKKKLQKSQMNERSKALEMGLTHCDLQEQTSVRILCMFPGL